MKSFLFFLSLLPLLLYSQNYNTELLSHIQFTENSSNIWGYADTNGREYAIIGRISGTSVFDVTDPRKPVLLKHIFGAPSSWREIKSWKNRLYVVADRGADGVLIINMEKAPQEITSVFWKPIVSVNDKILNVTKAGTIDRSHDLFIDEKGFCYLTGSNFHSGVVMLNLNKNPDNPEFTGIFNPNYTHDSYARNDTFWSADIIAGEFTVWDVKDKTNVKKLASQRTGSFFTHNIWLSDDGKYAFTTDERSNAFVEAYKVDNLANITLVDKYRSRTTQIRNVIPHNTYYHKGFLVTSYYTDGFTVVDASDPVHMVEVGAFDTYPAGDGDFHGCWGVYPYLPSGNILASDIEFGLFVVKPTYIKASYLKGIVLDSITKNPISDAFIKIEKESNLTINTKADGSFKSGGPYTGKTRVTISKPGYETKTIDVDLKQGTTIDVNISLQPLTQISFQLTVIDAISKAPIRAFVTMQKNTESLSFQMNAEGKTTTNLTNGIWNIIVGAWGYKYVSKPMSISKELTQSFTIEMRPGYEDHFIFTYDWTAVSTATAGIWGKAEPIGSYLLSTAINPEEDLPFDLGDQCMITGNGSTSVTGGDVDNGYSRLISPPINLKLVNKPSLSFYAWTARLNTIDSLPKFGSHKVYLVSAADTLLLDTLKPNTLAWTRYSYTIDTSKLKQLTNVRIIFEAFEPSGIDARNVVEFGVDGFLISDLTNTATKIEIVKSGQFKLYPNPVQSKINLEFEAKNYSRILDIYNLSGEKITSHSILANTSTFQCDFNLPGGAYMISLIDKNKISSQKFIKL